MKWTKFTLKTTTEAVDLISSMLDEIGIEGIEIEDNVPLSDALDADDQIIGYQFVSLGKMTDFIKKGDDPNTAWEKAKGQYGRVADAVKIIDPRQA